MRKADFDHVIASAALICGEEEIVVIGSQSIWGSVEDPPEAMLRSLEASRALDVERDPEADRYVTALPTAAHVVLITVIFRRWRAAPPRPRRLHRDQGRFRRSRRRHCHLAWVMKEVRKRQSPGRVQAEANRGIPS